MTAKFMKINQKKKEEGKKEAIEETWTRVQCEDTKRVLPAEKRAMKEAEWENEKKEEERQESKTGKELGKQWEHSSVAMSSPH